VSSFHRLLNILLKQPPIGLELQRGLLVQRIFRVGLQEKILEPIDYGVDGEDGLPILPEDVQAHIALQVDIGVIHLRLALHLRGLMRVSSSYFEAECELTMSIKALIRVNHKFEAEEVIWIWELSFTGLGEFQFIYILYGRFNNNYTELLRLFLLL